MPDSSPSRRGKALQSSLKSGLFSRVQCQQARQIPCRRCFISKNSGSSRCCRRLSKIERLIPLRRGSGFRLAISNTRKSWTLTRSTTTCLEMVYWATKKQCFTASNNTIDSSTKMSSQLYPSHLSSITDCSTLNTTGCPLILTRKNNRKGQIIGSSNLDNSAIEATA